MPTRDTAWPQGTPCWIDCQVDDTAAARRFYGELFGWEILDSPPEAGGYLMAMRNGRPAAGIGPKPENMPMPSAWTTYFAADSADDIAAKVSQAGGQVFMPPFDVMDVGRMFVAADPTGAPFGVWQARSHTGAGIYNEAGAYSWNELHTRAYETAQRFYAEVFGWTYTEVGDGQSFVYSTFTLPAAKRSSGGMCDDTTMPGDSTPYWLTWFQVEDTDATGARATDLGATILMGPDDSFAGRMSIIAAPQGEVFGVIDPSHAVGEPPSGAAQV
jgi:predicted enzyme related to lactoylglutathione lyase